MQTPSETLKPTRARITWRETPDTGFGKPQTWREVREAADPSQLHELFWAHPSWPTATTKKIEIVEVKWLDANGKEIEWPEAKSDAQAANNIEA